MNQIFPQRLTLEQNRKAQRYFLAFAVFNALSFAALGDSVLILFGLRLGAGDFHIGLLASYIQLAMVFMLLGKFMVGRWGAARTYGLCWFSRNIVAALFILAPWFYERWSPEFGLYWLLGSSFMFFVFRAMGIAAHNVLLTDLTDDETRGRFLGITSASVNLVTVATLVVLSVWLRGNPSLFRFQVVVAFGCFMGIISAWSVSRVRETEVPMLSSREPLLWALSLVLRQPELRRLLLAWVMVIASVQLLVPFQVLAVKRGYLLGDDLVIRFVAFQMMGSMAAAYLNSLLVDRAGPRPVLIINMLGLVLMSVLWVFSGDEISFTYTDAVFFFVGFCTLTVQVCLSHYLLNTVRKESLLNLSLVVSMLEGGVAGLAGTFIGGGLLHYLPTWGLEGMSLYRSYFLIVVFVQILTIPAVLGLKPLAERRVKEVLGMMFSLRDWRAMLSVQRLSQTPEVSTAQKLIDELAILRSGVSEKALLEYLDSPLFTIRAAALEALNKIDLSREAEQRLIKEVRETEFTTAFVAAEILGMHHVHAGIPALQESLKSKDYFLAGKAMLALAQLGDRSSYGRICQNFADSDNPRLVIHGARAIHYMGDKANISLLLQRIDYKMLEAVNDEILHTVFSLLGWGEENFKLMTLYNRDAELGIDGLDAEVSRAIRELRGKIVEKKTLAAKWAVEELRGGGTDSPDCLVKLFEELAMLGGNKFEFLDVLLKDQQRKVREAPARVRFGYTELACFLYLKQALLGKS